MKAQKPRVIPVFELSSDLQYMGGITMAMIPRPSLFGWDKIDAASDLERLRLVLSVLTDEPFMRFLERCRGRGRNDYPVRPMWNALVAGIVYRHASAASLLLELRRNRELLQVCGFDPLRGSDAAPSDDAFGRFLSVVVGHRSWVQEMVDGLIERLSKHLPDLGRRVAVDSKAIASFGRPVVEERKRQRRDGRRDVDADFGKKTYKGVRGDGSSWDKVFTWFGYKLHLLVDSRYELPLAFQVTPASKADVTRLLPLVEDLEARHPSVAKRVEELSADKAYDTRDANESLYEEHGIKPVIDTRTLWKEEKTRPLLTERPDSFVYDERGQVSCVCPKTGEMRDLAFSGFEKDRGTLKYRCPAAAYGYECAGRAECEALADVGEFGRTLRVPLDLDRRIFTPIARTSRKWEKAYARRTSVERVNSRIDRVLGFELHFIRGQAKMEARVGLALLVLLAMALGRIEADQADLMRSFVAPVRRAA